MHRLIIISLVVATLLCGAAAQAKAEQLYAVLPGGIGGTTLLSFDSATPGTVVARPITGLPIETFLLGIDFRPANGLLYGISAFGGSRVWTINPLTAQATLVATLSAPAISTEIDFDPVEDRLRVVTQTGQNLRVNVDTGEVIADGSINPGNPQISGTAYTNNFAGATSTTLYGISGATDSLYTINPATGTITLVGGLGVDDTLNSIGFDISGVTGIAYAALRPQPGSFNSSLYTINLATGQATLVGQIGTGFSINNLTAAPAGSTVIPEPTTLVLLGTGLLGVGAAARKRRQASQRHERRGCSKGL